MSAINVLVAALIASLAAVIMLVIFSDHYMQLMSDHGAVFILAIGLIGLVGAREKTPGLEA